MFVFVCMCVIVLLCVSFVVWLFVGSFVFPSVRLLVCFLACLFLTLLSFLLVCFLFLLASFGLFARLVVHMFVCFVASLSFLCLLPSVFRCSRCLCACAFGCLPVCLFDCFSLFVCLCVCLFVWSCVCVCVCVVCVCVCVCPSVWLPSACLFVRLVCLLGLLVLLCRSF